MKYLYSNPEKATYYHLTSSYAFFGPDRMMFRNDYLFGANAGENLQKKLQGVKVLNIPQEVKEMIPGGKAKKNLETS